MAKLCIEGVSKAFGEKQVLSDINLTAVSGEFVALRKDDAAQHHKRHSPLRRRACSGGWAGYRRPARGEAEYRHGIPELRAV